MNSCLHGALVWTLKQVRPHGRGIDSLGLSPLGNLLFFLMRGVIMEDIDFIHFRGLLAFLFILVVLVLLTYAVWGKL